jgi:hypothetical protein
MPSASVFFLLVQPFSVMIVSVTPATGLPYEKTCKCSKSDQNTYTRTGKKTGIGKGHLVLKPHEITGSTALIAKNTGKGRQLVTDIDSQISPVHQQDKSEKLEIETETVNI